MEILQNLAFFLGLPVLAGIRFYAAVFMVGLFIRLEWVILPANLFNLEFLAHPAVLIIAGLLAVIDFIVDKFQFADNTWHTIQTFLHPFLMAGVIFAGVADMNPIVEICLALLAGAMTLSVQGAQTSLRAAASISPEPISNAAISTAEDVGVVTGGVVLAVAPWLFAVLAAMILIGSLFVAYFLGSRTLRIFRQIVGKKSPLDAEGGHP